MCLLQYSLQGFLFPKAPSAAKGSAHPSQVLPSQYLTSAMNLLIYFSVSSKNSRQQDLCMFALFLACVSIYQFCFKPILQPVLGLQSHSTALIFASRDHEDISFPWEYILIIIKDY